jgi:peptidoglycan/LPS O-acetylase OafA/YrhL
MAFVEDVPFGFWRELVARNPLLWFPHFVMGMLLARYFGITRHGTEWRTEAPRGWLSWGDVAFTALVLFELFFTAIPAGWFGPEPVYLDGFLLRHGLLVPIYYVIIYDLAVQRGLLSRLLSLPGLKMLGDASFTIFMLQLPAFIFLPTLLEPLGWSPSLQLFVFILATIVASFLSTNLFEKPVARRLRSQWEKRSRPIVSPPQPVAES